MALQCDCAGQSGEPAAVRKSIERALERGSRVAQACRIADRGGKKSVRDSRPPWPRTVREVEEAFGIQRRAAGRLEQAVEELPLSLRPAPRRAPLAGTELSRFGTARYLLGETLDDPLQASRGGE